MYGEIFFLPWKFILILGQNCVSMLFTSWIESFLKKSTVKFGNSDLSYSTGFDVFFISSNFQASVLFSTTLNSVPCTYPVDASFCIKILHTINHSHISLALLVLCSVNALLVSTFCPTAASNTIPRMCLNNPPLIVL